MADINPDQVKEFRTAYNCLLNDSRHQYGRAITRPIGGYTKDSIVDDYPTVQVEPGIDVTLMRDQFHNLIADAAVGRAHRQVWARHPAVADAYHQYLVLLELTRRNENTKV